MSTTLKLLNSQTLKLPNLATSEPLVIVSTDYRKLDIKFIHRFLTNAYWAKGRTIDVVRKSIENSFCFGIYLAENEQQIGFARVITDFTIFAYLMDVFIDENHRGKGYSKLLLKSILEHPELHSIETWRLGTSDAHGLYTQFGFKPLKFPEKMMEKKMK